MWVNKLKEEICNLRFSDVYKLLGYSDVNNLEIEKAYDDVRKLLKSRDWDQLVGDRFSWLFIKSLVELKLKKEFIPEVINEIEHLENPVCHDSITKLESRFEHEPLKGLWHKHFHLGNFKNLKKSFLDHITKPKKWNQIEQQVKTLAKKRKKTESNLKIACSILKAHTIDYYMSEMEKSELTGEWIIYHEFEGQKYYLGLWNHDDNDNDIVAQIHKIFRMEFPELSNQLSVFSY